MSFNIGGPFQIFSFDQSAGNYRNVELELWQYGRRISTVTLNFFHIGDIPRDWIIEFSDPIFGNRWQRDEINLVVNGRTCPYPVHSQHDRRLVSFVQVDNYRHSNSFHSFRYIWSSDNYLSIRGRGACTSFPDTASINCRTQRKLSNIEQCPGKCSKMCTNGYCDCATGECPCNPGFSGIDCQNDLCGHAQCVYGISSARYLGEDIPMTKQACVCMTG